MKNVICILGKQGYTFVNNEKRFHVGSVKPVDSVAEDSFNGALCFGLANDCPIEETLKMTNAIGALTTFAKGATQSIKTYDEFMRFMSNNE